MRVFCAGKIVTALFDGSEHSQYQDQSGEVCAEIILPLVNMARAWEASRTSLPCPLFDVHPRTWRG